MTDLSTQSEQVGFGLRWVPRVGARAAVKAVWTTDPDLDDIKKEVLTKLYITDATQLEVRFLAQGDFNKVYEVRDLAKNRSYVFRATLPVFPQHKTACEVATLKYVRAKSNVPVPRVYAFDDTTNNTIGLEYIIQEFVVGTPIGNCWDSLSEDEKVNVIRNIARAQVQLFNLRFTTIGGLRETESGSFESDLLIAQQLFWLDRYRYEITKGPFQTTAQWLEALLEHIHCEARCALEMLSSSNNAHSDQYNGFRDVILNVERLQKLLPYFFLQFEEPECHHRDLPGVLATTIYHPDLSMANIIIDPQTQEITGIIDWENVSTVPIWAVCEFPSILCLRHRPRYVEPDIDFFDDMDEVTFQEKYEMPGFDNKGKEIGYWQCMREWERTNMRPIFLAEMAKICPEWIEIHNASRGLRELLHVISCIDVPNLASDVSEWINCYISGQRKEFFRILHE